MPRVACCLTWRSPDFVRRTGISRPNRRLWSRKQLEQGSLRQAEGPTLPSMTITAIQVRPSGSAVDATLQLVREVAAGYCETAGPTWAKSLEPDHD